MIDALDSVKSYLEGQYQELLGDENWRFLVDVKEIEGETLWLDLDTKFRCVTPSERTGAAILDSGVGICLIVQKYNPDCALGAQLTKGLQIRSNLLPVHHPSVEIPSDSEGTWRVIINWLVEEADFLNWIEQVADLREKSAHFEEVPIDAIVNRFNCWETACKRHQFPRLLFSLRTLFMVEDQAEIEQWQNADAMVSEKLKGLPQAFEAQSLERHIASSVLERIEAAAGLEKIEDPFSGQVGDELDTVRIKDFRNIKEMELRLRSSHSHVGASVVQGPNGSGKSSILEAISIGLLGTSERHLRYLNDPVRRRFGRGDKYLEEFLTRFSSPNDTKPSVVMNGGAPVTDIWLCNSQEEARQKLDEVNGNIFSQEHGESLVGIGAEELGAQITAAFSSIAQLTRDFVDNGLGVANNKLREFNSRWQLRGNVRKRETVIEKIAAQAMAADISLSPSCIGWLNQGGYIETSYDTEAAVILIRWQEWQNKLRTSPSRIASSPNHQTMEREFGELLNSHQSIVDDAEKLIATLRNSVLEWQEDLFEQLASWGVWLESQEALSHSEDEEIQELQAQKSRQSGRLGQTLSAGEIEGRRLRILKEHSGFVNNWCSLHENLCFVCETNLEERGGLQKVFSDTQEKSDDQVKSLRDEFKRIKREIVKLDEELSSLGVSTPPISSEDQSEIIRLLGWICPKGVSIKTLLSDPSSRAKLFELLQHIKNAPPQNVGSVDVKSATENLVRVVSGAIKDHTELSLAPSAWQAVQKEMISRLSAATSEFLPKTTSALWLEIAKNLMPAPWQYPGELSLTIDETSKSPAAVVSISNNKKDTLANYILNGAEVHILGVAWFLSNYITKGRFKFPFMVLDDPAVMMDQPTYRDFCRLAETIIRLHKTQSRAFTFVCLLHQDSRAVDLARATSATLHQLKWNRNTPVLGGNYRLEAENVAYPLPARLFRAG